MARPKTPLRDRFLEKTSIQADGCVYWTGYLTNGYGTITRGGRSGPEVGAHRVAYELFVGEVPDGMVIDHLCRITKCVAPAHLEPVTNAENVRRGFEALRPTCPRGHEYDRVLYGTHRRCRTCYARTARERRARKKITLEQKEPTA